jgi:hypothetical protein
MFLALLFLGGCGGCGHEQAAPAPKPAGQQAPAAGQPAAQGAQPAQPEAPAGEAPPAAAPGQVTEEDDCIVIADANPDYGPPPLSVAFSAEAECTRGQPTYKWDFGDGSSSTDANPSHTYPKVGDFTATVTVTAGAATATDEIDITVEEDAEPEEP